MFNIYTRVLPPAHIIINTHFTHPHSSRVLKRHDANKLLKTMEINDGELINICKYDN